MQPRPVDRAVLAPCDVRFLARYPDWRKAFSPPLAPPPTAFFISRPVHDVIIPLPPPGLYTSSGSNPIIARERMIARAPPERRQNRFNPDNWIRDPRFFTSTRA